MAKLVSKVYGDALFSLAVEENRVDELWDETRAMKQVLSENPDFMAILEHPEMTMEKKDGCAAGGFSKGTVPGHDGAFACSCKKRKNRRTNPCVSIF
ncbi:MAG: F0F1 ATP synthase subunit delta [Clostridium sp.]